MPTQKAILSREEYAALGSHLLKHKIYPYEIAEFSRAINGTNFATADGSLGSYFTLTWTPQQKLGIVTVAANFIITDNSKVGTFAMMLSYKNTVSLQDKTGTPPINEGNRFYSLISNGGAINDLQNYFPLNFYVEAGQPIYLHVWGDNASVTAGTATITGSCVIGALTLQN